MDILKTFSEQEILNHLAWLENEIDVYHEYDLLTQNFEMELKSLKKDFSHPHNINSEKAH